VAAELHRPLELSGAGASRVVTLHLTVSVRERGKSQPIELATSVGLPPAPYESVDELRAALLTLQAASDAPAPAAGSVLLRLPGASDDWSLPDDLWLNSTPYRRSVRNMFYLDVLGAMERAVADPSCSRRMRVVITPPELNMEMDTYRVGTLLELVREAALGFAQRGLACRVCVQGSMGQGAFTGVPRVLSGVNKLLAMMDWQANAGEDYEGALGNLQQPRREGLVEGLVRLGAVGPAELAPDDDVVIILAPQSMVGASIFEPLSAMVEQAEAQGAAVILINPLLQDRQSSGGVMSVRGRSERLAFAASFEEIYHFRLLYSGTTFMFPILGAVRMARPPAPSTPTAALPPTYVLFQRRESEGAERYEPVGSFSGREPTAEEITSLLPRRVRPLNDDDIGGGDAAEAPDEAPTTAGGGAPPASATDKFAPPSW